MKLRLKGNSIRLRLTRGEVSQLADAGLVEEYVDFGPSRLAYAIETAADGGSVEAAFRDGRMSVRVPVAAARRWAESDEVGIYAHAGGLKVSVEKDFACLKPRAGEDESDMFPHPDPHAC